MDMKTSIEAATVPQSCETKAYAEPVIKTLDQQDILQAVAKGSKFPARGFAG